MKKLTSVLVLMVMLFGIAIPASAAKAPKASTTKPAAVKLVESALKTGMIKAFTETSVTILENGKTYVLPLVKDAKILQNGEAVDLMEMAKKGLKVQFKAMLKANVPVSLTYLVIPPVGAFYEGILGTSCSTEVNNTFSFKNPAVYNVNLNGNSMVEANKIDLTKSFVTDKNDFVMSGKDTLFVGNYDFVANSFKLAVAGKDLKVTEKDFDAAVVGDEVKYTKNKAGEVSLVLEVALTDAQIADIDNVVKLGYQINEYNMQRLELTNLLVNEDVYAELNGKEVSYAKAMYRGNYFVAGTNERDEIVYVNAYYRDLKCVVDSVKGGKITVSVIKNGNQAFKDTLVLNEGCTIADATGKNMEVSDLKKGAEILISNNPDVNYEVISIIVQ